MDIIASNKTLDNILQTYRPQLAGDFTAYRNHSYRVLNLTFGQSDGAADSLEKIAIACAFHDLAIWTHHTFDYLEPSAKLARDYLCSEGLAFNPDEIEQMIVEHHKITKSKNSSLADAFRKADWFDVTFGVIGFGIERKKLKPLYQEFPEAGFHWRLVQLTVKNTVKHPLKPLPMFKW